MLARYLDILEGNDAADCELHEPYIYMNGLSVTELEDLQADIEVTIKINFSKLIDFQKFLSQVVLWLTRTLARRIIPDVPDFYEPK